MPTPAEVARAEATRNAAVRRRALQKTALPAPVVPRIIEEEDAAPAQQRIFQSPDVAVRTGQITPTAFDPRQLQRGRGTNRAGGTSRVSGAGLVIDPFGFSTTPARAQEALAGVAAAPLAGRASPPSPPAFLAPDTAVQTGQAQPPAPGGQRPFAVSDPADIALLGRIGVQTEFRPLSPSVSAYRGPTGQVGPNEFVVTDRADVALINRVAPGANVFYANPTTGELWADSGVMAFVPALTQYLAGEELPDSVVQVLINAGLLDESGAVTSAGSSLGGGTTTGMAPRGAAPRFGGTVPRFSGTRGASFGLVNWRI